MPNQALTFESRSRIGFAELAGSVPRSSAARVSEHKEKLTLDRRFLELCFEVLHSRKPVYLKREPICYNEKMIF